MSITYSLSIATGLEPTQVKRLIFSGIGLERSKGDNLRGVGVFASVGKQNPLNQDIVEDEFGFRPSLSIVFEIYPSEGYEEGMRIMGNATAAVLRYVPGDAIMLAGGEDVALLRICEHLIINEGWSDWVRPQLDAANIPYEQREIVTPAA